MVFQLGKKLPKRQFFWGDIEWLWGKKNAPKYWTNFTHVEEGIWKYAGADRFFKIVSDLVYTKKQKRKDEANIELERWFADIAEEDMGKMAESMERVYTDDATDHPISRDKYGYLGGLLAAFARSGMKPYKWFKK